MHQSQKNYDAIIIGGGHNGLVAACYLAKAGKTVLLLEAHDELGGATTSVKPFPEYDARLSRYSYLVSLLPDQIVSDLGINFKTLERSIASYTPYRRGDRDHGLLISNEWDETTANSFNRLTGSDQEGIAWREFYDGIAMLAKRFAPTMLQPLKSAAKLKSEIDLPEVWRNLMEIPIGEVIRNRFSNDLVQGMVLTDALIGTFVSANDMQANRCFLYHLIGNGTGQWRVPQGGMGALVNELCRIATLMGVTIKLQSKVSVLESSQAGVRVETESGECYTAKDLLFAAAPQHLARLCGQTVPKSLEGAQLKINMLVSRLPRLKSGIDPKLAFAGTFHVNESYSQLEAAYQCASAGDIPLPLPLEMYRHTLTDLSILSKELSEKGFHTLTLFGLHTPAKLFDADPEHAKALAKENALASLNQYLLDPIEIVLAPCHDGSLAIEVKSPLDLEKDIFLPRGNIFHRDLEFPFLNPDSEDSGKQLWGAETDDPHIYLAGAGARRGGGVSGIAGHNAAMALLSSTMKLIFILFALLPISAFASEKTPEHTNRNLNGWVVCVKAHLLKGEHEVRGESPALKLGFKNSTMDKFDVQCTMLKAIASTPVLPALKQTKTTNPGRPVDTWLGSTIQELQGDEFSSFGVSKESGGVHLTKVPAKSLAAKAGFRDNDLIQGVNGKTVTGLREFFGIVNSAVGKPLSISFVRNQKKQAATVTLPTKE